MYDSPKVRRFYSAANHPRLLVIAPNDIWAAYSEGAFKPSARPYLGYLMLLEDCDRSRAPVKTVAPHFPVFPEFSGASYRERYMILIEKLLRDRLYDGACFLLSEAASAATGAYTEPHMELTF